MQIVDTIAELRERLGTLPRPVLVPTMGNLHAGHLSLVRIARSLGAPVVVSIFVNRLQFGPNDDFDQYPRTFREDCERLEPEGCDIVFAPKESEMYPELYPFRVQPPAAIANILEGQFRPGFFSGVCTAVLKLFHVTQPRVAVFGKKDYQQVLIIRNIVEQLALPIDIVGGDIVRDASGLALSSRNNYLNSARRSEAVQLNAKLRSVAAAVRSGQPKWRHLEREAIGALAVRGWKPDYVAIRRQADLGTPDAKSPLLVVAAARLGTTRLIDNLEIA
jgi:pantoate--beta-alanine ligase